MMFTISIVTILFLMTLLAYISVEHSMPCMAHSMDGSRKLLVRRVAESDWSPSYRIMICGWHHSPNKQTNDLFWQEWQLTENLNALGGCVLFRIPIHGNLHSNYGCVVVGVMLVWNPQRSPFIWSSADIPNHQRPFGSNWRNTINLARVCYSS